MFYAITNFGWVLGQTPYEFTRSYMSQGSPSYLSVFVQTIAGRTDASGDNAGPGGKLSFYPRPAHSRCRHEGLTKYDAHY